VDTRKNNFHILVAGYGPDLFALDEDGLKPGWEKGKIVFARTLTSNRERFSR
jgi:hypothetical protein